MKIKEYKDIGQTDILREIKYFLSGQMQEFLEKIIK